MEALGNIKPVTERIRTKYQDREIVIAADNDQLATKNVGLIKAIEAANVIDAKVAVPFFSQEEVEAGMTDFNDLEGIYGSNLFSVIKLKEHLNEAMSPADMKPAAFIQEMKSRFHKQRQRDREPSINDETSLDRKRPRDNDKSMSM